MNDKFSTPDDPGETSYDLDAMLAAEGAVGVDKEALPKRKIRVITPGDDALDPMSQWHIPAVEKGDLYLKGAVQPIIQARSKLLFTPILSRTYFKQIGPSAKAGKSGNEVKATWRREPKGTVYVPKMGRRCNGDLILKCGELYCLIGNIAWLLELSGMGCKTLDALNEHVDSSWWADVKGEHHPCALYSTKAALWTVTERDDRDNECINIKLAPVAVYHEPNGPTRDEVMRARDLHNELKKTLPQYPDPDAVGPAPALRVVGGDTSPWSSNDDGPLPPHPDDPGPTPYDEPIPF